MIKRRLLILFLTLSILVLVAAPAFAQSGDGGDQPEQPEVPLSPEMSSAHFRVDWYVIANSNYAATSTHFKVNGTVGQPTVGFESSPHFGVCNGFWCFLREWKIRLPLIFKGIW